MIKPPVPPEDIDEFRRLLERRRRGKFISMAESRRRLERMIARKKARMLKAKLSAHQK